MRMQRRDEHSAQSVPSSRALTFGVQQQVLGFEIAVDVVLVVHVLKHEHCRGNKSFQGKRVSISETPVRKECGNVQTEAAKKRAVASSNCCLHTEMHPSPIMRKAQPTTQWQLVWKRARTVRAARRRALRP